MKRILLGVLIVLIGGVIVSCSDYSKIVRGDDYQRKFEAANEMFENGKFSKCIVLYEQIYQHSPRSGEGELAYYRLAKSYFEIEDFYMAEYYFGSYLSRFPFSNNKEKAAFSKVMCSVRNSPNFSLDQSETNKAINDVQEFIYNFPESPFIDSCNVLIDGLRLKLEKKDFEEIRLYSKTEKYRAAVTSADIFIGRYPKSIFLEEAFYLMVKNSIFLARNSVDSKKLERIEQSNERFLNFAERFSNSKFLIELKTLKKTLD